MNRTFAALLALAAALPLATSARAQRTPVSLEPRAGLSTPIGITRGDQKTALVLDGDLIVALNPMVSVYGGYAWSRAVSAVADSAHVTWRGWDAGVRLTLAPVGPYTPFVRGGLLYQKVRLETDGGTVLENDYATGVHIGAGVELPLGILGGRASVSPQASFNTVHDAQWIDAQVGLHIRL
ncbi:outer membrane beta-barrel protein [Longimicrobium sp.]|uniref:outer membrane beta-barrel protein n=1 Tax=Longimicrobium sp. TaxID=2029185 RepID=UPI002B7D5871|nr:outer membrane beta-barrel protein [Longimicrobium sp.]HSU16856.1 outer membrane beta-barrel protein [Longimicrobium sp.]